MQKLQNEVDATVAGHGGDAEVRGVARERIVEHSDVRRKSGTYNGGYSIAS